MAGISTKKIKNRIRSMESTRQITKAVEMVASAKLRGAQRRLLSSRAYFDALQEAIADVLSADGDISSSYLAQRDVKKSLYVIVAGDRGLAGGYNSNILKLALGELTGKNAVVLPVGKKSVDFFKSRGISLLTERWGTVEEISITDCLFMANTLCEGYLSGEYDEIFLFYTNFQSALSLRPLRMQLLPLPKAEKNSRSDLVFEPDGDAFLHAVVPSYLGGILYGALCESYCSELAARRTAMDAASRNAEDRINELSLQFNRARQSAITGEIIDIVAGS